MNINELNLPTELKYTKSHEWVLLLGNGQAQVGVSDYAQQAMGDIVFVNLPEIGDEVTAGEAFSDCESVKAVEDIRSPFSGEVTAVNEVLLDQPELLNSDPYGAWLIQVGNISETGQLLDALAYRAFCESEAN